jgi:putative SOS response-associated peptidase YedK
MCGRYAFHARREVIERAFGVVLDGDLEPRYNVAPTQLVPVVRADRTGGRVLRMQRWGLVPHWARDVGIGARMINARAETLASNAAFRDAFDRRRCLVPVSGFYEWSGEGRARVPHYVTRADGAPFALAGLWARWRPRAAARDAPPVDSCTIVTTDANALVAPLHERMPVILPPEAWAAWLDPALEGAAVAEWLRPAPIDGLEERVVSRAVNDVRNEGEALLDPPDE